MNKEIKKIIDSEKEDIKTIKKIIKGETVKPRFNLKELNLLGVIADNWLFTIILIAFLLSGFFLGAISFEQTCNKALIECQDECNELLGFSESYLIPPLNNVSPELPMSPSITDQEE